MMEFQHRLILAISYLVGIAGTGTWLVKTDFGYVHSAAPFITYPVMTTVVLAILSLAEADIECVSRLIVVFYFEK